MIRGATLAAACALLVSCADTINAPSAVSGSGLRDAATPRPAKVVISQVYGGGGNSGAQFQNDFIELFNTGETAQDLTGWSVQYAAAGGNFQTGSAPNFQTLALTGSIQPGRYYLVKMAAGNGAGVALPTADATGTAAMSATSGKVALVDQTDPLGCGASGCDATLRAHIIDLVGYGTGTSTPSMFETASAATLSNTTAAIRNGHGCTDTDNNSLDFAKLAPAPRNSATTAAICVVGPLSTVTVAGPAIVVTGLTITLTATLKDANGLILSDPAAQYTWTSTDPSKLEVVSTNNNTVTIKGKAAGSATINITATSNGVTKSATGFAVTAFDPAPIVPSTTVVSEIHYDNVGTDANEQIEIQGDAGTSLNGWSLVLYDGTGGTVYSTTPLSGSIPSNCTNGQGVVVVPFPVNGIQNGAPDGWVLMNAQNQITEFRSYEGTFTALNGPAVGLTSTSIGVEETSSTTSDQSLQRALNGDWFGPTANSFNACNAATAPILPKLVLTDGKTLLSVGMQTQFFYDDNSGTSVKSVVWSSSDPTIFTVDAKGIVSAKKIGKATLTAVSAADENVFGSIDVQIYLAPGSTGIRLGHNEEFGEPRDADDTDDFLIHRDQYTVSYNQNRGGANWVSWNLDATHVGTSGRCPGTCYSADTALINAHITAYTTADWVSNSQGQSDGYDRGHMAPSADWTVSEADNNTTFFLSNFLPQRHDLNAGPWERLENDLRDSVSHGREAYIIAGGIFTNGVGLGTLLNKGQIAIPDSTWKIVVLTPAGSGIGQGGTLPPNSTVLAVNMPNVTGIIGEGWEQYQTTVDKIQRSTGYDFLDALSEPTECLVEVRNCAPTARITAASFTGSEGQSLTFSGATSSDPNDGDVLTKQWSVNGTPAGSGDSFSYTFPNDGTYQITLVVTDSHGSNSTAVATVAISNVAPVVGAFSGATVVRGQTYSATGSFTDPGADSWSGTVNYGDGSTAPLAIAGHSFSLAHTYAALGNYTVTVSVNDGDATDSQTATVQVIDVAPVVGTFPGATILRGETYTAAGSFTDPDPDSWTGTVNYGDGTSGPLSISGHSFDLSHAYATAGTYTVVVTVNDGTMSASRTATVVVKTAAQGIADLQAMVAALGLNQGQTNSLQSKLSNAAKQLADGKTTPAANMIEAFMEEISAIAQSGRISAATSAQLTSYAQRVIASF